MKKVIVYQAKDGSTHSTPTSCKAHDARLAIKPAAEAFVATLGSDTAVIDVATDLADFIVTNADALGKVLTEPLIVRKPRKAKAAAAKPATPAPAAAASAPAEPTTEDEEAELESLVAALN